MLNSRILECADLVVLKLIRDCHKSRKEFTFYIILCNVQWQYYVLAS